MITAIVNKILGDISSLPFVDRYGGIVKIMTKNNPNSSGGISKIRYPAVINLKPQQCGDNSTYIDMIPNNNYMSMLYFEHRSTITVNAGSDYQEKETILRLVWWGNMSKINPIYTDTDLISSTIISKIPKTYQPFNGISGIYIELIGEIPKNADIFGDYTYDEAEKQYITYPYDYFALDYRISYRISNRCLDDIQLSPDVCEIIVSKCDRLWNNLTDSEKLECLLPKYDFAKQIVINSLTQKQINDLINSLCDPSSYTCAQLKSLLTDDQKECIIQDAECPDIFDSLTWEQKECVLQSYDFADPNIYNILTYEQLKDIIKQLDCILLQELTDDQKINCILPLYDFSDASIISGLSPEQKADLQAALCPICPTMSADFQADNLSPEAFNTSVTFTDLSSGVPYNPDTWSYEFIDNGSNILLNTQNPSYVFKSIGEKTIKLIAANSTNGACDVKTKTSYITVIAPVMPSGLVLWLDPERGVTLSGVSVVSWSDQSGNGNNAFQNVIGSRPQYLTNANNNRPAISFDGLTQFLDGTILNLHNSSFTMIVVSKNINQSNSNPTLIRIGSGTTGFAFRQSSLYKHTWATLNNSATFTGHYIEMINSALEVTTLIKEINVNQMFYSSDVLVRTTTASGATAPMSAGGNYTIGYGQYASTYFKGIIGDILVFNRVLNYSELSYVINTIIKVKYDLC